jgi:hypothetical protein
MEVPIFTKSWEIALFLILGIGCAIILVLISPIILIKRLWKMRK